MGQCLCRWGKDRREVVYPLVEVDDALLLLQARHELEGALCDKRTVFLDSGGGEGAGPRTAVMEVEGSILDADQHCGAVIEHLPDELWRV